MFRVDLTDSQGFLFCTVKIQSRDTLKETLAKYEKISGLSIEVKENEHSTIRRR